MAIMKWIRAKRYERAVKKYLDSQPRYPADAKVTYLRHDFGSREDAVAEMNFERQIAIERAVRSSLELKSKI